MLETEVFKIFISQKNAVYFVEICTLMSNKLKGLEHKPDNYEKRDFEKTRKTVEQSKISLTCKDSYHILSIT